jgi:hypothetical protein
MRHTWLLSGLRVEMGPKWFFNWVLPLLLALLPPPVGVALLEFYLAVSLGWFFANFPPLELNTFEALRAPSRRALYAVRLTRSLPWLSWLGVTAATSAAWSVPWAGGLWVSLAALGLVALVPLCFLGLIGSLSILLRTPPILVLLVLWLVGPWFAGYYGFEMAQGWWMHAALLSDPPVLLVFPVALGVLAAGLLALQVWAVEWMEPARQIGLRMTGILPVASTGAVRGSSKPSPIDPPQLPRLVGAGQTIITRQLLRLVGPGQTIITRLWIAHLVGYFGRFSPGLHMIVDVVFLVNVPFMVTVALDQPPRLDIWTWLPVGMVWLYPSWHLEDELRRPRLYVLGVDYRSQLLSGLSTFWASPPTLFATVLLTGIALFGPVWDFPLAIAAAVLGVAAFRRGWWDWPEPWLWGRSCSAYLTAVLASLGLFLLALWLASNDREGSLVRGLSPVARLFLFAGAAGGLGAGGMLAKLLCFDERTLRRVVVSLGK